MHATEREAPQQGRRFWTTVLLFDFLLIVVTTLATFFFDFFAGTATLGFGIQPRSVHGTGMFYLYMAGYFTALVVVLPMLQLRRFWVATAVYLPFVILGFPISYYFEWVRENTWVAPWSGLGWTGAFLLVGFCADLTFRYLPARLNDRVRAIGTSIAIGLVSYLTCLLCLRFVYKPPHVTGPGAFQGLAYFGLPWLLINSAFGGYTAYAIWRKV